MKSHLLKVYVAALALLTGGVAPAHAATHDQAPEWVKQAAAQPLPAYPARTDAVVLLDDTDYTVAPDGTRVVHVRRVVKILRQQGRRYGVLPASQSRAVKLRNMHLWSIAPDGHEFAAKDSDFHTAGVWNGFELYSDEEIRVAELPGMDAGAVAAVEYEQLERPYENDIIWIPEEGIPSVRQRLTLTLPAGFTYRSAWKGRHDAKPVDLEGGRSLWEVQNVPAVRLDGVADAPAELSLASRLDVFYTGPVLASPYPQLHGDWKDIGVWYTALASGRNVPDAAIRAKAEELVAGKTAFTDRVEAIGDFVQQQIRYVAVEVGVGGHQPHPAPEIFAHRYGDCKDKATLLSAMLDAVGVHSTWVMVDTKRGVIAADAPSILGNHMVAAIELPPGEHSPTLHSVVETTAGKRFLIFDPTWEKTPFGVIEKELQGSDALLVDGAASQAIHIPVMDAALNPVERRGRFQLTAEGSLSGTVHEEIAGDIAADLRMVYAEKDAKQRQKLMDRDRAEDLVGVQLTDVKATNMADLSRPATLDYQLKADHVGQEAGPLLMLHPRVLGREAFAMDQPGTPHRTVPIDLGSTRTVHDVSEIELPAGYTVEELPRSMDLDLDFASYHSRITAEGNKLRYDRTYTLRAVQLPPDRYADVEQLSRTIYTDEEGSALLKRAP